MKRRRILLLLSAFALLPLSCEKSANPGAAADPADLLPADNDISSFSRQGPAAVMTDYQTIMDAIDGAAEKYIDLGFVEGVSQRYGNGAAFIDVTIFNQGSSENARALLQEFYPASPEVLLEGDPFMVVDHGILTGYSVYYVRENIYIRVDTSEKSEFMLSMARQFCRNMDRKLTLSE